MIYLYQKLLSPDKSLLFGRLRGRICAHHPHCSQYAIECFRSYGFFCGFVKTLDRITRCNPSITITYDPPRYRVVFFSSAPIGIPFLEALRNDSMIDVVGIVTMPDEPQGRGMQLKPNIIKEWVEKKINETSKMSKISKKQKKVQLDAIYDKSVPFIVTPPTLSQKTPQGQDFLKRIEKKQPDYLVVIAYGHIIPQAILDVAKIIPINVHGSLLPKLRGASPIQSIFFEKNEPNEHLITGITLIKMTKEMDAGPILGKISFPVPFERTSIDVVHKMEKLGPSFLLTAMKKYPKGYIKLQEQNENEATYCTKYTKKDGQINPRTDTLENTYVKYRAFALWPKIRFTIKDTKNKEKRIIIEYLELEKETYYKWKEKPLFINPENELPSQQFINPAIKNFLIKPEGKKVMTRNDFLNGNKK